MTGRGGRQQREIGLPRACPYDRLAFRKLQPIEAAWRGGEGRHGNGQNFNSTGDRPEAKPMLPCATIEASVLPILLIISE